MMMIWKKFFMHLESNNFITYFYYQQKSILMNFYWKISILGWAICINLFHIYIMKLKKKSFLKKLTCDIKFIIKTNFLNKINDFI